MYVRLEVRVFELFNISEYIKYGKGMVSRVSYIEKLDAQIYAKTIKNLCYNSVCNNFYFEILIWQHLQIVYGVET